MPAPHFNQTENTSSGSPIPGRVQSPEHDRRQSRQTGRPPADAGPHSTIHFSARPRPITAEVAAQPATLWWGAWLAGEAQAVLLQTEALGRRHLPTIWDLYREMLEKDGHLFAAVQTRKNGVLCRPRALVPASDDPADQRVAAFVGDALEGLPHFEQRLADLLDALPFGFAVQEILWRAEAGRVCPAALRPRPAARFLFDDAGAIRLLAAGQPAPAVPIVVPAAQTTPAGGAGVPGAPSAPFPYRTGPLPARKFLTFLFGASPDAPYGRGLCMRAYWYYWFKKNNLKFWATFNERFGAPTVVGRFAPGTSEDERRALLDVLDSLQTSAGVALPQSVSLELLEASRSGTINTYKDFADWCNDEMSKIVLGATLTTGEGRRSGSLALGRVHERVRSEYVESDAKALMDVINHQLIRWIVDFNFGPDVPAPRWTIDTTADEDLSQEIEVDRQLVALGVPLPLRYFYERYRRPAPITGDKALRYDDNNLYQYHLYFGVLTINEVRASLGLPPVPWGDAPPRSPDDSGQREHQPIRPRLEPLPPRGSGSGEDPAPDAASLEQPPPER
ncbi:MAG: hypothetical protein Kow0059_12900 [Candidatus Sumerlaeia bacterium]